MFKTILTKIGFFLFEFGINLLIKLFLGSDLTKDLEKLIEQLENEELTSKQKYNRAKKFLDQAIEDAPDIAKNLAIESIVAKIPGKSEKFLKYIKNKI